VVWLLPHSRARQKAPRRLTDSSPRIYRGVLFFTVLLFQASTTGAFRRPLHAAKMARGFAAGNCVEFAHIGQFPQCFARDTYSSRSCVKACTKHAAMSCLFQPRRESVTAPPRSNCTWRTQVDASHQGTLFEPDARQRGQHLIDLCLRGVGGTTI